MKKIFIPLFILILVILSSLGFANYDKVNKESPKQKFIHIIPLGDVNKTYLDSVKVYIEDFYGFKCIIEPKSPLTQDLLAASKTRYEAKKIITKFNSNDNRILITNVDIATQNEKRNISEWGVIGLGWRPGKTCIVSTYRLKKGTNKNKFFSRFRKVTLHEIGHNLGLDHCNNKTNCLMNDKNGSIKLIDLETDLCDNCKKIINMK